MDPVPQEEKKPSLNKFILPPQSATKTSVISKRDALLAKFLTKAKEAAKKLKASDFNDDQVDEIVETLG